MNQQCDTDDSELEAELTHDRRRKIVQLRRDGHSVREIGKNLKIRAELVVTSLDEARKEYLSSVSKDYEEMIAEQFGALVELRTEALKSFDQTKHTKGKPAGDAKFLAIARDLTNDIINFLGLKDRQDYEMRRAVPTGDNASEVLEVVVNSRDEVELLRDENGNISLAAYQKLIQKLENPVVDQGETSKSVGG